jgi:hypothetical protein
VHGTGRNRRITLMLHGCCRLEATGRRVEAGLHVERGFMLVFRSKSVEELPSVPNGTRTYALHIRGSNGQFLHVRQRKLGTIIIQTVHILQHDSAVTGSLPDREFLHGQTMYFQLT